jgi:hypothetical protein
MTVYTGFARHHGAGKAALESGDHDTVRFVAGTL